MFPRSRTITFMTVPRFPFFPFTVARRANPFAKKCLCGVIAYSNETKFSKISPVENKRQDSSNPCGFFFIIAVMGTGLATSQALEIQTDSKKSPTSSNVSLLLRL